MFQVTGVTRHFGPVLANNNVSVTVHPGEVVGLLGENGAGKSTLLAILAGYIQPDAGTIRMDGQSLRQTSPGQAIRNGVGLVHQHLSVISSFTVKEQLRLSGWTVGDPLPEMIAGLDLNTRVEALAMGQRQRLEIAKTLLRHPKVLLLDEPTSILAPSEVDILLNTVAQLASAGLGIVLVSHKLREVQQVASRMIIMRAGSVVGEIERDPNGDWPVGTEDQALGLMFGWVDGQPSERALESPDGLPYKDNDGDRANLSPSTPSASLSTELALEVRGISVEGSEQNLPRNLSFSLARGHLYAVVGIDGQGQRELALAIAGYIPSQGDIRLSKTSLADKSARHRSGAGVALLVDDRLGEAAIGSLTLAQNVVLKYPRPKHEVRNGIIRWAAVKERTHRLIADWQVTPDDQGRQFGTLSGGNMQRLLAARELDRNPTLLIAINPVHGLDWQTTQLLWSRLRQRCAEGGTVLVFTGDLDEAMSEADEIAVMNGGVLGSFLLPSQIDGRDLARQMVIGW